MQKPLQSSGEILFRNYTAECSATAHVVESRPFSTSLARFAGLAPRLTFSFYSHSQCRL